jgi:predicted ABC-type ATPase
MTTLSQEQLSAHYFQRIQRGIRRRLSLPGRQPRVLFIAGQPGAGKTTMQAAAIERLGLKKAYVLDHDELLDQHPNYASAALENDYAANSVCDEDAATWRVWALQDVQARRMDVVVPFPISGQHDLDLLKQFQDKGYRVEVAFAAVHEAQSQLGLMERFIDSRQEVGYGRWISGEQHDQIYRDMLGTADAIEAQELAGAVHVYRRGESEPIFTNERTRGGWRHPSGSSRQAIETERNRPWTDREVNHFVRGWNRLSALASRPLREHFKAMPLMASDEGRRLLGRLSEMAGPKIAEHQQAAAERAAQQSPHDWQRFAVRLQTEQSSPGGIPMPTSSAQTGAEAPAYRPQKGAATDQGLSPS